jgi:hypothetical protein
MKTKSKKLYDKSALIRCTEQELKQLHQRAITSKLSLSRFFVKSALSDGQVLTAEDKEEIRQLRFELYKIGSNLNQISKAFNASRRGNGEEPTAQQLKETLEKADSALEILLDFIKNL